MNEKYRRLKQKYNDIDKQISNLHAEQREIRNLMEQVCTHENVIKMDIDPFLHIKVEEETKYKCTDCYRYFTEDELKVAKD
ncbi:hypothetical protein [Virgibacillus halodenitrificans]|uniref:hypothetical protein n=1 Tax=Virgibacillus halodenitrificans TaxID=1482 RepID=UPI000EF4F637|nr:hypothetical protein [Virgibacillus halodenitrificans]